MDNNRARNLLERQIEEAKKLTSIRRYSPEWKKWQRDTEIIIQGIFGPGTRHLSDFSKIEYSLDFFSSGTPDSDFQQAYVNGLQTAQTILQSMIDEIAEFGLPQKSSDGNTPTISLGSLFDHFHVIARQLRERHAGRSTLEIEDEYDVQDLLHALLHQVSDDIRPEEWTPSYAGGSARMDFLLKEEKTVVEVKKTRKDLTTKAVGEQLIIDIARYQGHPNCEKLICFIYDPEARIANPRGFEKDLTKEHDKLKVEVIIAPRIK